MNFSPQYFMQEAYKEALKAFDLDEIPIGAIVVCQNKIIGRGHNLTERLNDVTAHAEMQAMTAAANYLNGKYLDECILYVTIEPCVMCAGASNWMQLSEIVFGANDDKKGFLKFSKKILHPKTKLTYGIMDEECGLLMKEFFKAKR